MAVIVLFTKNVAFREIPPGGSPQLGDQTIFTARGQFSIPTIPGQLSGRAAITGGTEAYVTARGQVSVTTQTGGADRLEIDIR